MSLAADKKKWDDLHAALAKATEAKDAFDRQLHAHYGRYEDQWLTKTQRAKLAALRAKEDKIGEKIYELVERISPRQWDRGVPTWWVRRELTWEDAIRPKGEPLSVVVPGSYGSRDGTVTERESSMARRTSRKNTPESAGSQYATDQIASEHFSVWVRDQMLEASKADPSEQLPLETKADARVIAGNMLKQLEWDTSREVSALDVMVLIDPDGENVGGKEKVPLFWRGFRKACDNSRDWLADELLTIKGEMGESRTSEMRASNKRVADMTETELVAAIRDCERRLKDPNTTEALRQSLLYRLENCRAELMVRGRGAGESRRPKAVGSVRRRRSVRSNQKIMTPEEISAAANELPGRHPRLKPTDGKTNLLDWLATVDPNGEWARFLDGDYDDDDEPLEVDDLWAEIWSITEAAQ